MLNEQNLNHNGSLGDRAKTINISSGKRVSLIKQENNTNKIFNTSQGDYLQSYIKDKSFDFEIDVNIKTTNNVYSELMDKFENKEKNCILNVTYFKDSIQTSWLICKSYEQINLFLVYLTKIYEYDGFDSQIQEIIAYLYNKDLNSCDAKFFEEFVEFFKKIIQTDALKKKMFVLEFLEISVYTFNSLIDGIKYKEGYIENLTLPKNSKKLVYKCACNTEKNQLKNSYFVKKWFILKEDIMFYMDNSCSEFGKDTLWLDQNITITDSILYQNSLKIVHKPRNITLRFSSKVEQELWKSEIKNRIDNYSVENNSLKSFSKNLHYSNATWLVEGSSYFRHLAYNLSKASETIFIAGWWVSPEVPLIRPFENDNYSSNEKQDVHMLKNILHNKAKEGVKIYIIVYKEIIMTLPNNSKHTKRCLEKLHPNIKVLRFPKTNFNPWSNHEKMVVIDQKVGYVGGIDLCWGRYDLLTHNIYEPNANSGLHWPGIDYYNGRIKDIYNAEKVKETQMDRKNDPRLPWHDVACFLEGYVVLDIAKHFIERWSHANNHTIYYNPNYSVQRANYEDRKRKARRNMIDAKSEIFSIYQRKNMDNNVIKNLNNIDLHNNKNLDNGKKLTDNFSFKKNNAQELRISKTVNIQGEVIKLELDNENDKEINNLEHDKQLDAFLEEEARDLEKRDKIERKKNIKESSDTLKNEYVKDNDALYLKPKEKSYTSYDSNTSVSRKKGFFSRAVKKVGLKIKNAFKKSILNIASDELFLKLPTNIYGLKEKFSDNYQCQLFRSASEWSVGVSSVENSIYRLYYKLIEESKHYIYIENQFFISKAFSEEEEKQNPFLQEYAVKNRIAFKIRERVERAYINKERFKVYILFPSIPGFPGNIKDSYGLQKLTKFTMRTTHRFKGFSILERLYSVMGDDVFDYVQFLNLRKVDINPLTNIPGTEQVYIHAKIIIVDDLKVFIGSANINDRSMMGDRDSELGVLVQGGETVESILNGAKENVSKYAFTLRMRLLQEHMGYPISLDYPKEIVDPVSDEFFNLLKSTAKSNAEIIESIFPYVYPSNTIYSYSQLSNEAKNTNYDKVKETYDRVNNKIKGHIVNFPIEFLKEEKQLVLMKSNKEQNTHENNEDTNKTSSSIFKDKPNSNNKSSILDSQNLSRIFSATKKTNLNSTYFKDYKSFLFYLDIELNKDHSIYNLSKVKNKENSFCILKVDFSKPDIKNVVWDVSKTFEQIQEFLTKVSKLVEFKMFDKPYVKQINKLRTTRKKNCGQHFFMNFVDVFKVLLSKEEIKRRIFLLEFLEISILSFITLSEGIKYKEGYIDKLSKQRSRKGCMYKLFCCDYIKCKNFYKRWFVVKDDMMFYIDNSSDYMGKDIFWYDQNIIVNRYNKLGPSCLRIANNARRLTLRFKNNVELYMWENEINNKIIEYKKQKFKYNSFSSVHKFCSAQWFVEASNYYKHLYKSLMNAKESIFIAGWWISPELPLIRPFKDNDFIDTNTGIDFEKLKFYKKKEKDYKKYMLKNVLLKKAKQGVKINILMYKEVSIALPINSLHTKTALTSLHKNIKVVRFPKSNLNLLWSNHEKIVIIDQSFGYVGGIDLCWNRYDDESHVLHEFNNLSEFKKEEYLNRNPNLKINSNLIKVIEKKLKRDSNNLKEADKIKVNECLDLFYPGIDFGNARIVDVTKVNKPNLCSIDRKTTPRMPWHDVSSYLEGHIVADLAKHFIERWTYATNYTDLMNPDYSYSKDQLDHIEEVFYPSDDNSEDSSISSNKTKSVIDNESISTLNDNKKLQTIENTDKKSSNKNNVALFQSKSEDLRDSFKFNKDFNSKNYKEPLLNGNKNSYLPSKVEKNCNKEDKVIKNNLVKKKSMYNIDSKFLKIKEKVQKDKKTPIDKIRDSISIESGRITSKIKSAFRNAIEDELQLKIRYKIFNENNKALNNTCQLVRSSSEWSVGVACKENSILEAYYSLISDSKHYILIENQYFISRAFSDEESDANEKTKNYVVINRIALMIRERIVKAHRNNENFKAYIFIPAITGFAGDITTSYVLQAITKLTYKTICRNKGYSLLERLYNDIGDEYKDYIVILNLRQHEYNPIIKEASTEMIYIHSKILLVDDNTALIGSANINDRSMLGDRDSEVCTIIKDTNRKIKSTLNGNSEYVSEFVYSLRIRLFQEHFGFKIDGKDVDDILIDPTNNKLFNYVKDIADNNLSLYEKIFPHVYPNRVLTTYKLINEANKNKDIESVLDNYIKYANEIKGNITSFPSSFLKDEKNVIKFTKEAILPRKNFA